MNSGKVPINKLFPFETACMLMALRPDSVRPSVPESVSQRMHLRVTDKYVLFARQLAQTSKCLCAHCDKILYSLPPPFSCSVFHQNRTVYQSDDDYPHSLLAVSEL